jgi:hypothetical protein
LFTRHVPGGRQIQGLREQDADGVEEPLGVVVPVHDLDHFLEIALFQAKSCAGSH